MDTIPTRNDSQKSGDKRRRSASPEIRQKDEDWHKKSLDALQALEGHPHFDACIRSAIRDVTQQIEHLEGEKAATQGIKRIHGQKMKTLEKTLDTIRGCKNDLLREKRIKPLWDQLEPQVAQKIAEVLETVQKNLEHTASSSQGDLTISQETARDPSSSQSDHLQRTKRPASSELQSMGGASSTRSVRRRLGDVGIESSIAESTDGGSESKSLTKEERQRLKTEIEGLQSNIEENANAFSSLPEAERSKREGDQERLRSAIHAMQRSNQGVDSNLSETIKQLDSVFRKRKALQRQLAAINRPSLPKSVDDRFESEFKGYDKEEQSAKESAGRELIFLGRKWNPDASTYLADLKTQAEEHKTYMSELDASLMTLDAQVGYLSQMMEEAPSEDMLPTRKGKGKEKAHYDQTSNAPSKEQLRAYINTERAKLSVAASKAHKLVHGERRDYKTSIQQKHGQEVFDAREALMTHFQMLNQFALDNKGELKKIEEIMRFFQKIDTTQYMEQSIKTKDKSVKEVIEFLKGADSSRNIPDIPPPSQHSGSHQERTAQKDVLPQEDLPSSLQPEGHLSRETYHGLRVFMYICHKILNSKEDTGSLSFEVKPKEAPKLLPGQTTSDATILQPNSPGRIESQDTNENALLAAHEKIALNPLMTSDNTIGKFIRLVKKSGQMRPLEDLQEIALDLLKNKGSFSKGFQIGNRLNDDEHSLTSCMVRLALSHDPSLETADKRKYSNALVYQSQRAYENRHPKKEPVELNLIDVPPSS